MFSEADLAPILRRFKVITSAELGQEDAGGEEAGNLTQELLQVKTHTLDLLQNCWLAKFKRFSFFISIFLIRSLMVKDSSSSSQRMCYRLRMFSRIDF